MKVDRFDTGFTSSHSDCVGWIATNRKESTILAILRSIVAEGRAKSHSLSVEDNSLEC